MTDAFTQDGFSQADLLSIGTRRSNLAPENMSATDINATIPFAVSEAVRLQMDGYDENLLKQIGERKITMPNISATEINRPRVDMNTLPAVEKVLAGLQNFLGIRTK